MKQFTFKEEAKELFKRLLIERIDLSDLNKSKRESKINIEIEKNNMRIDRLKDMYVNGEISKEDYEQLKQKYEANIYRLKFEKSELKNINKDVITQLEFCTDLLLDLPKFYEKATIDGKQQLIGSIFTGNLIFVNKKVRTTKINEAVSLITNINRCYRRHVKEKPGLKSRLSHKVKAKGQNSNTFEKDLNAVSKIAIASIRF